MKAFLNPYVLLAALLTLLLTAATGYWLGGRNARNACDADAGRAGVKVESRQDARDLAVDGIGADTDAKTAAAAADTMGSTYESAERIRTVYVPAPCRAVPPGVQLETDEAVDRINGKIRSGVRPGAADAGPASAED